MFFLFIFSLLTLSREIEYRVFENEYHELYINLRLEERGANNAVNLKKYPESRPDILYLIYGINPEACNLRGIHPKQMRISKFMG